MPWTFKSLLDGHDENIIKAWMDGLPASAKAKLNARVRHLAVTDQWPRQWVKKIQGYDRLFEMRVIHFNIQYRPLGCYGPGAREFTFVLGAIEQGDRISPPNAFQTAEERCEDVRCGRSRVCDHSYQ